MKDCFFWYILEALFYHIIIKFLKRLKNVTRHIGKVINFQSMEEVKKLSWQTSALQSHDESSSSHFKDIKIVSRLKILFNQFE